MRGTPLALCCVCTKSRPGRAGCRGATKELVSNRGRWLQSAPSGHTRTKVGVAKPPVYHARLRSHITIAGLPDLSLPHHAPRGCMDSPSAEPPMAACCDLLASAGFATDSTVGDCDHEPAEPPCHPCAAGLSRWARLAVRCPSWSAPSLGCYIFSTRCGCRARFCAGWFPISVMSTWQASENIRTTTGAANKGALMMVRFSRRIF